MSRALDGLRRGTAAIALGWLAASCGGDAAGPGRPANAPSKAPIHLVDATAAAGLDAAVQVGGGPDVDYIIESLGAGAAWLDYDGDGDADLYLVQGATPARPLEGPPDRLLRNDGDPDGDGVPAFVDVTAEAGLGDTLWSFGAAVADYDNDGDADLYLTNWGPNRLYRNNGNGTFTDVAAAAGVADAHWGSSSVWGDIDRDGDLDLYLVNYVAFTFDRYPARGERGSKGEPPCTYRGAEVYCGPRNLEAESDVLFRNDGDPDGDGVPTFTDVSAQAGVAVGAFFGLGAVFFDGDNDGDEDLYVANDSVQNLYFVNRGNGTFEEAGIVSGLAYDEQGYEQASMGIAVGDYDRNGRFDVAVTNFSHDHDTLYRNDGDLRFSDVSYPAGIGTPSYLKLSWGVSFIDLDQDGWEDLIFAHGNVYPQVDGRQTGTTFKEANSVFRNRGDGGFDVVTADAGPGLAIVESSRALLPVDLDGDGDVDVLFTNYNAPPTLLMNRGAPGRWLQVRLEGVASNRDGIGARITLRTGGREQIREMRRSTAYAGSTLPVVHFGVGDAEAAERLEVRWPSGAVSILEGLETNRLMTVREPTGGG